MKVLILIAVVGLMLTVLAWFLIFKSSPQTGVSVQPQPTPTPAADAAFYAYFKTLLFADQSLEELLKDSKSNEEVLKHPPQTNNPSLNELLEYLKNQPPELSANNPLSLWASSLNASRQGRREEAKKYLKQVLTIPDTDSRVRLSTWKALRDLGELPSPKIAAEVQGVICELHNEDGVGTLAAYSDGRARWIGGQGAMTVWEAPGTDAELSSVIQEFLKSAEPLIQTAPATDKHKTPEPEMEHFRISILTYGGIHTVEAFGPEIIEGHRLAPMFVVSLKLLNTLQQKAREAEQYEKQKRKVKP
jgi:hypothetical protein